MQNETRRKKVSEEMKICLNFVPNCFEEQEEPPQAWEAELHNSKKFVEDIRCSNHRQLIGLSFTVCPHLMQSGASDPLITKKTGRRGEDLSRPVHFFLSTISGVYGWVRCTIFDGGLSVK